MKSLLQVLLLLVLIVGLAAACAPTRRSAPEVTPSAEPAEPSPGTYTREVVVQGRTRSYIVHVPTGYAATTPLAAVLSFHGGGATAEWQVERTGMNDTSDAHGFIVAYPQGTPMTLGNGRVWNAGACCGSAQRQGVDDVAFTRAIIDDLEGKYAIDKRRIFATGISNGGMMVYRLACELADRIAAIAPVAATSVVAECHPSRPVSVLAFHGTADEWIPFEGGKGRLTFIGPFPSIPATIQFFVSLDGCQSPGNVTYQSGNATCVTYTPCADNTAVTLCTIEGGGHTWPGGKPVPAEGLTSTDISANEMMWDFFEAHPLPGQ